MPTSSFEIVVAIRPPYEESYPLRAESPEVAALLGQDAPPAAAYWLDTSQGVAIPLDAEQFRRASRAYQSGHRRFKVSWQQGGLERRIATLEPANTLWGDSMPNAANAIASNDVVTAIDERVEAIGRVEPRKAREAPALIDTPHAKRSIG